MSKAIALMGPPGSGKTWMSANTAVNRPVHFIDIDRKVRSMTLVQPLIEKGDVTAWELTEPLDEDNLKSRIDGLVKNVRATKQPMGWTRFAEYVYELPKSPEGKSAGTWVLDSTTRLGEHLRSHISYLAGKSKFTWDLWNAWLIGWRDTLSYMIDIAKENNKDLIWTFHERVSEVPGSRTSGVRRVQLAGAGGEPGGMSREYLGVLDVKVAAAISGQFGIDFGSYFEEVYALRVDVDDKGKQKWVCRVKPDGLRDLRTSFNVSQDEFNPSFKDIWK